MRRAVPGGALQRRDRRELRDGVPTGTAPHSPDGASPERTPPQDGAAAPGLSYAPVNRTLSEEEKARLVAHRPDELIRPVPRHLVALPTPRRALAQARSRLNHLYLLSSLETPYKDGSGDGPEGVNGSQAAADTADPR